METDNKPSWPIKKVYEPKALIKNKGMKQNIVQWLCIVVAAIHMAQSQEVSRIQHVVNNVLNVLGEDTVTINRQAGSNVVSTHSAKPEKSESNKLFSSRKLRLRVVDDLGRPVSGASVKATTSRLTLLSYVTQSHQRQEFNVVTDENGSCELKGIRGRGLSVKSITKSGFELATMSKRWYDIENVSDEEWNKQQPIIFQMWRLRGAEPLLRSEFVNRIQYNQTPLYLDVMRGKLSTNTATAFDLVLTLMTTPESVADSSAKLESWKFTVKSPDGGVQKVMDPFFNEAPEKGYTQACVFESSNETSISRNYCKGQIYLRTRNGVYGRLEVFFEVGEKRADSGITVILYANPSGSRNLEYDGTHYYRPPE